MPDTAAYYADKLVTFSGYDREALLLLAKVKTKLLRTNITHDSPGSVRDKVAGKDIVYVIVLYGNRYTVHFIDFTDGGASLDVMMHYRRGCLSRCHGA